MEMRGAPVASAIEIFFCYAREDEELLKGLEKQLHALKLQGSSKDL